MEGSEMEVAGVGLLGKPSSRRPRRDKSMESKKSQAPNVSSSSRADTARTAKRDGRKPSSHAKGKKKDAYG
jgi:hypothetical protein